MSAFSFILGAAVALAVVWLAGELPNHAVKVAERPVYDVTAIAAPKMSGFALQVFAWAMETWPLRAMLHAKISSDSEFRLPRLATATPALFDLPATPVPRPPVPSTTTGGKPVTPASIAAFAAVASSNEKTFRFRTIADYATAYASGTTTPTQVVERFIAAVEESETKFDHPLRVFISIDKAALRAAAAESTARHAKNATRGTFDGVPVAVKDEFDVAGLVTTGGTRFVTEGVAKHDATVVARLRKQGALILGKTNMHEIGAGVTGMNPWHGFARNPFNIRHVTGGSSSGSAAAVAAGFAPVAIGADGGGSIRIPSGLCGLFGLKATYGRISDHGAFQIAWSVTHAGPMTGTARDLAASYALMAGQDEHDPLTTHQPAVSLEGFDDIASFKGLRVGVFSAFNGDSAPVIQETVSRFVKTLEKRGAVKKEVEIPGLQMMNRAHAMTIGSEMAAAMSRFYPEHRGDFGADVRVLLSMSEHSFSAVDYVASQKVRTYATRLLDDLFESVDVIVMPLAGVTAPEIPEEAIPAGIADTATLSALMRFVVVPNLTGHPAITFPFGHDNNGLPVAVQVIGRNWDEALLLRLANLADSEYKGQGKPPQAWWDLLQHTE